MSLLEALIIGTILLSIGLFILPSAKRKQIALYLQIVSGILFAIYMLFEGFRLQMVPMFIFLLGISVVNSILFLRKIPKEHIIEHKIVRIVVFIIILLVFTGSALWPILQPVVNLP